MNRAVILKLYVAFLQAYASDDENKSLQAVQTLGRELFTQGVHHEQINQLHKEAVVEVTGQSPDFTTSEHLSATSPALIEVLMAYCLAFQAKTEVKNREAMDELRKALGSQNSLMGWQDGAITAQMAGIGPLRLRLAEEFAEIKADYNALLDVYLEAMGFGHPPPRRQINMLAERIGTLGGGPRDVVDIHLRTVTEKCKNAHPKREYAYAIEGRLMALELMGFLVDYYRLLPVPVVPRASTAL
jgi:hypothetical protein